MALRHVAVSTDVDGRNPQIDQQSLDASEARHELLRLLRLRKTSASPTTTLLNLIVIDLTGEPWSYTGTDVRTASLARLLLVLQIPSSALCGLSDVVFFQQWPASQAKLSDVVGENVTCSAACQTSGVAWTFVLASSCTVGLLWFLDEEGRREVGTVLEQLESQSFLTVHPLALALWSHESMLAETIGYAESHALQIVAAQEATGYHRLADLGTPLDPASTDFRTLSAAISGTAANIATNQLCLQGLHSMAEFILGAASAEPSSALYDIGSHPPMATKYIRSQIQHQLRRNIFELQHVKSWQTKADIILQALFHISAQRDQRLNTEIAQDSRALAKISIRDATSMKAIAAVTMIFLPGTSIAVSQ